MSDSSDPRQIDTSRAGRRRWLVAAVAVLLASSLPVANTAEVSAAANLPRARVQRSAASSVLVGLGPDGSVCVLTYVGASQIVVDVAGWFGPGADGLAYRPSTPERLLDTRLNARKPTNAENPVHVDGVTILNVAAVDSTALGYVAVRPCGSTLVSSLINTTAAEDAANLTAVGGDANGNVCVRSNIPSHFVADQMGTFAP